MTDFREPPAPPAHAAAPTPADLIAPAWQILQRSQAATAVADLDGRLVYVNPAWLALWGYDAVVQVLGRPFDAGFWHDAEAARGLLQAVLAGQPAQADLSARHRDGSAVAVRGAAHLVVDGDGQPLAWMATFLDRRAEVAALAQVDAQRRRLEQRIAERTRALALAKEDAERASAAKTEFLSRMSHELRTPLNAILGFGQLLELAPLAAEDAGHVQEVLAAGRHLLELIDEMLDLAAIEAGHIRLQLQPVALAALVDECLRQITPTAQQAGLRLEARIDASCLPVHADRARLRQVLSNLLSNAVKYNRSGGHIVVESHCAAQVCELRVHDSGPGLSAEQIGRLFQPFERLDADRRGIAGTGIGLSVSKRLVELMGGSIGVSSQPGVGSVFQVRLPTAAAAPAALPAPPPAALASQDGVRAGVLYVDDHEANRRLMQQALQRRPGLRVRVAADAESALALACAEPPALLLLDIQLPGLDGHALLAQLRAAGCSAPAVAVSAYAMPEDLARGRASGFVDYLTKPLDLARTLAVVDRLLAADGPD